MGSTQAKFKKLVKEGQFIDITSSSDFDVAKKMQQRDPAKPIIINLWVHDSFATDETVTKIVETFPFLLRLKLPRCGKITDTSLSHISKLASLQVLYVDYTNVTDTGVQHLSHLISLQHLSLSFNARVTDAALRHLSGLAALKVLDLEGTTLTNAGLICLVHLPSLDPRLLFVDGSGVTKEGLDAFKKQLLENRQENAPRQQQQQPVSEATSPQKQDPLIAQQQLQPFSIPYR